MADKRITVACPSCNTYTELEKGFFNWKKTRCPQCSKKITFEKTGVQVVTCDHCKKNVLYDAARKNSCPVCGGSLSAYGDRLAVGCPVCSMPVYYRPGETEATCLNCGGSFNPCNESGKQEALMNNNAPDIRMPGTLPEEELFWKHPLERMPVSTRVIAKGGMYAVGIRGTGRDFIVDGQSAYLTETSLMNDAAAYDGSETPMVDVEIYYVRHAFTGKFRWGGASEVTDRYRQVTKFCYNGTAEIDRITDPAAFLRFINFDADATVSDFRMHRPEGGAEEPGRFASSIRDVIRNVCQGALEAVRDRYNTVGEELLLHKTSILAEIEQQANQELAKWGISVRNIVADVKKIGDIVVPQDELEKRLAGSLNWQTPGPVVVHMKDKPQAYANLLVNGSLYVTIDDPEKLNRCKEAPRWRAEASDSNMARNEISRYVGETLRGRIAADIQQLVDDLCPPLYMLQSHTGYLGSQALRLLNREGGFLAERGMSVSDLSIAIEVGEKSAAFALQEKMVSFEDELSIREKMEELTRGYEFRKGDATTDQAIHDIGNKSRLEEAQAAAAHTAQMQQKHRQAEAEALQRALDFDAWNEDQRLEEAKESAEYARARRQQLHSQESHTLSLTHERDILAIARQIEQSKLDWREKLDAYARLQRGMAFQDEMDQRNAAANAEARETRLQQELRAEDRKVMDALDHEQALRNEEIAKMRFAREMEKRREELAAQAAELQAKFDRERALADEKERRAKAQEENDKLRLMLEYLAKSGAQQVTAEHLRLAREEARQTWQRDHEAQQRKENDQLRQEQKTAEKEMADRAQQMVDQLLKMQNELVGKQIDAEAVKAVGDTRSVIEQLNALRGSIQNGPAAPQAAGSMNQWFESLMNLTKTAAAQAQQAPATFGSAINGETRICGKCGRAFSVNAYMCPECKWRP